MHWDRSPGCPDVSKGKVAERHSTRTQASGSVHRHENIAAGRYDVDTVGYVLRDVSQAQATATKVFGPVLGADGGAFVTEVAVMHVHDMPPGKGVGSADLTANDLPLESPAGSVGEDDPDDRLQRRRRHLLGLPAGGPGSTTTKQSAR